MSKHLIKRTLTISIIFGVLFFCLNYFGDSDSSVGPLLLKSVMVIFVFGILYFTLFAIISTPERKYKFGITIPIALLITIIISALFSAIKAGIIIGLILGIIAGYTWEFLSKNQNGGDK